MVSNYFLTTLFGRTVNSPLQFLQILFRLFAQSKQYVHSNEHIIASEELDKTLLQISHSDFISNTLHSHSIVAGGFEVTS